MDINKRPHKPVESSNVGCTGTHRTLGENGSPPVSRKRRHSKISKTNCCNSDKSSDKETDALVICNRGSSLTVGVNGSRSSLDTNANTTVTVTDASSSTGDTEVSASSADTEGASIRSSRNDPVQPVLIAPDGVDGTENQCNSVNVSQADRSENPPPYTCQRKLDVNNSSLKDTAGFQSGNAVTAGSPSDCDCNGIEVKILKEFNTMERIAKSQMPPSMPHLCYKGVVKPPELFSMEGRRTSQTSSSREERVIALQQTSSSGVGISQISSSMDTKLEGSGSRQIVSSEEGVGIQQKSFPGGVGPSQVASSEEGLRITQTSSSEGGELRQIISSVEDEAEVEVSVSAAGTEGASIRGSRRDKVQPILISPDGVNGNEIECNSVNVSLADHSQSPPPYTCESKLDVNCPSLKDKAGFESEKTSTAATPRDADCNGIEVKILKEVNTMGKIAKTRVPCSMPHLCYKGVVKPPELFSTEGRGTSQTSSSREECVIALQQTSSSGVGISKISSCVDGGLKGGGSQQIISSEEGVGIQHKSFPGGVGPSQGASSEEGIRNPQTSSSEGGELQQIISSVEGVGIQKPPSLEGVESRQISSSVEGVRISQTSSIEGGKWQQIISSVEGVGIQQKSSSRLRPLSPASSLEGIRIPQKSSLEGGELRQIFSPVKAEPKAKGSVSSAGTEGASIQSSCSDKVEPVHIAPDGVYGDENHCNGVNVSHADRSQNPLPYKGENKLNDNYPSLKDKALFESANPLTACTPSTMGKTAKTRVPCSMPTLLYKGVVKLPQLSFMAGRRTSHASSYKDQAVTPLQQTSFSGVGISKISSSVEGKLGGESRQIISSVKGVGIHQKSFPGGDGPSQGASSEEGVRITQTSSSERGKLRQITSSVEGVGIQKTSSLEGGGSQRISSSVDGVKIPQTSSLEGRELRQPISSVEAEAKTEVIAPSAGTEGASIQINCSDQVQPILIPHDGNYGDEKHCNDVNTLQVDRCQNPPRYKCETKLDAHCPSLKLKTGLESANASNAVTPRDSDCNGIEVKILKESNTMGSTVKTTVLRSMPQLCYKGVVKPPQLFSMDGCGTSHGSSCKEEDITTMQQTPFSGIGSSQVSTSLAGTRIPQKPTLEGVESQQRNSSVETGANSLPVDPEVSAFSAGTEGASIRSSYSHKVQPTLSAPYGVYGDENHCNGANVSHADSLKLKSGFESANASTAVTPRDPDCNGIDVKILKEFNTLERTGKTRVPRSMPSLWYKGMVKPPQLSSMEGRSFEEEGVNPMQQTSSHEVAISQVSSSVEVVRIPQKSSLVGGGSRQIISSVEGAGLQQKSFSEGAGPSQGASLMEGVRIPQRSSFKGGGSREIISSVEGVRIQQQSFRHLRPLNPKPASSMAGVRIPQPSVEEHRFPNIIALLQKSSLGVGLSQAVSSVQDPRIPQTISTEAGKPPQTMLTVGGDRIPEATSNVEEVTTSPVSPETDVVSSQSFNTPVGHTPCSPHLKMLLVKILPESDSLFPGFSNDTIIVDGKQYISAWTLNNNSQFIVEKWRVPRSKFLGGVTHMYLVPGEQDQLVKGGFEDYDFQAGSHGKFQVFKDYKAMDVPSNEYTVGKLVANIKNTLYICKPTTRLPISECKVNEYHLEDDNFRFLHGFNEVYSTCVSVASCDSNNSQHLYKLAVLDATSKKMNIYSRKRELLVTVGFDHGALYKHGLAAVGDVLVLADRDCVHMYSWEGRCLVKGAVLDRKRDVLGLGVVRGKLVLAERLQEDDRHQSKTITVFDMVMR